MTAEKNNTLTKIGVFYDGNYFYHVSNFYNYVHEKRSRFSIGGLHEFICHYIANEVKTDRRYAQIVDAHYFRGRLSAKEASQRNNQLYYERVFDDILMSEGVTTHYLPIKILSNGYKQEKEIDTWLSLEAFELAFYKKFDVLVLIASDGDYVPLVRKLNTLGTKVMVLSWDLDYTDEEGKRFSTRTSQDLLHEATYPVAMHDIIDSSLHKNDPVMSELFVPKSMERMAERPVERMSERPVGINTPPVAPQRPISSIFSSSSSSPSALSSQPKEQSFNTYNAYNDFTETLVSTILSLKDGYGFIKNQPENVFFHYKSLVDCDFNELLVGDEVEFKLEQTEQGKQIAKDVRLVSKVNNFI